MLQTPRCGERVEAGGKRGGRLLWGVRVVDSLRLREMWWGRGGGGVRVEVDVVEIDNLKIGIVKVDRF
jgi:hypothetical protein